MRSPSARIPTLRDWRSTRSTRSSTRIPQGAADLKARIALTFEMTIGGQRKSATELARDIATRLGGLTQRLHATGAGVAVPVDAQRLCEIVHCRL